MFSSDMQRRAAFANMFSRGFTTNGVVAVAGPKVCVEPKLLVGVDKKALKFIGKFSIGDLNRRVDIIEGLLKSKNLNDFQKDKLRKEKMELEIELGSDFSDDPAKRDEVLTDKQKKLFIRMHDQYSNEMSKHPTELGSVWVGNGYVHGPRLRQPEEFEFIKNVEPSPKFYHFKDAEKLPKSLPRGSKLVVGKLRKSGDWALQSTLVPIDSKLGKSLVGGKHL